MIVVCEKNDEARINTIHLIMGNESEFQLDFEGMMLLDITNSYVQGYRNIIKINRCGWEEDLAEGIENFLGLKKPSISQSSIKRLDNNSNEQSKTSSEKKQICESCGSPSSKLVNNICETCIQINNGIKNKSIPEVPSIENQVNILKKIVESCDDEMKSQIQKHIRRQVRKKKTEDSGGNEATV